MTQDQRQRKLFFIASELLDALHEYSRQSGARLDDLYDEALRDFLKKKGHPASLKDALQLSARQIPANDRAPVKRARKSKRRKSKSRSS